jgi:hypothetical protein
VGYFSPSLPLRVGPDQLLTSQEDPEAGIVPSLPVRVGTDQLLTSQEDPEGGMLPPSLPVRVGPDQLLTSQEDPEGGVLLHSSTSVEAAQVAFPDMKLHKIGASTSCEHWYYYTAGGKDNIAMC